MISVDNTSQKKDTVQKIVVFQQAGSGQFKIEGIRAYGKNMVISQVFDLPVALPELIDEPQEYLSPEFHADLVLNFLRHPDLSEYLVSLCRQKGIPVIASGQRIKGAITPFTCCGLGKKEGLGAYGQQFGLPEFSVEVKDRKIAEIKVLRGASCGATWKVAKQVIGMEIEEALSAIGRFVQYICQVDPSSFDPVCGKSALHYAGDVHIAALKKALKK